MRKTAYKSYRIIFLKMEKCRTISVMGRFKVRIYSLYSIKSLYLWKVPIKHVCVCVCVRVCVCVNVSLGSDSVSDLIRETPAIWSSLFHPSLWVTNTHCWLKNNDDTQHSSLSILKLTCERYTHYNTYTHKHNTAIASFVSQVLTESALKGQNDQLYFS